MSRRPLSVEVEKERLLAPLLSQKIVNRSHRPDASCLGSIVAQRSVFFAEDCGGKAIRESCLIVLLVCPSGVLGISPCFSGDLLVFVSCVFPPESSKSPATVLNVSRQSSHRVTLFVSAGAIPNLQCDPSRMLRIQACVGSVATARNIPLPCRLQSWRWPHPTPDTDSAQKLSGCLL